MTYRHPMNMPLIWGGVEKYWESLLRCMERKGSFNRQ